MDSDIILETRELTKDFKGFVAVNNVNLRVRRNTVHALIGPNGAGKTTCFNLITRFVRQSSGSIWLDGHDISHATPAHLARHGIGRSFQISSVYPHLSVLENVRLALQSRQRSSFHFWRSDKTLSALDDEALCLIDAVDLGDRAGISAGELPYGCKRALEIAATVALSPSVLLLDEPMAGLGREDVTRISALIRKFSDRRTVLMVEHNLSVVAELSDQITVLQRGEILAEGDYATISTDRDVIQAYLGADHD